MTDFLVGFVAVVAGFIGFVLGWYYRARWMVKRLRDYVRENPEP